MSNSSIEKIDNKYNFKIEYKLINNKELLKSRLSEIPKSSGCYLLKILIITYFISVNLKNYAVE